ncbi:RCC1 and BTB domain-containing protein 2 [Hondaea fermentalgiana]|uniref:RCC1 and BTB domain-containing protein 2 n=1 Tax=Hondaea fermentalgiana TaxID=2315210 RepID=A0A2R5GXU0_9STRA|nr:RCC1 and BTB domain-containing protein 2 [Hondaea fermentalgiana]|eukprot:GBG33523.1 RCC1 and BTB domain-containing protein 2 [Hondaea fermentalgiana]
MLPLVDHDGLCAVTGLRRGLADPSKGFGSDEIGNYPDELITLLPSSSQAAPASSPWTIQGVEPEAGTRLGFQLVSIVGRFPDISEEDLDLVQISFGDKRQRPLRYSPSRILCHSIPVPQNVPHLTISVSFDGGFSFTDQDAIFAYNDASIIHVGQTGSHVMHWGMAADVVNLREEADTTAALRFLNSADPIRGSGAAISAAQSSETAGVEVVMIPPEHGALDAETPENKDEHLLRANPTSVFTTDNVNPQGDEDGTNVPAWFFDQRTDSMDAARVACLRDMVFPRYQQVVRVAAGANHFCAITDDLNGAQLYTWGSNSHGQLGLGADVGDFVYTPKLVIVGDVSNGTARSQLGEVLDMHVQMYQTYIQDVERAMDLGAAQAETSSAEDVVWIKLRGLLRTVEEAKSDLDRRVEDVTQRQLVLRALARTNMLNKGTTMKAYRHANGEVTRQRFKESLRWTEQRGEKLTAEIAALDEQADILLEQQETLQEQEEILVDLMDDWQRTSLPVSSSSSQALSDDLDTLLQLASDLQACQIANLVRHGSSGATANSSLGLTTGAATVSPNWGRRLSRASARAQTQPGPQQSLDGALFAKTNRERIFASPEQLVSESSLTAASTDAFEGESSQSAALVLTAPMRVCNVESPFVDYNNIQ